MWLFDKGQRPQTVLVLLAALALGGCGFQPLYSDRAGSAPVQADLRNVTIEAGGEIGDGIKFRLEDIIGERGVAGSRYSLSLAPQLREFDVAVQQDTDVTRRNVRLTTPFRLYDHEQERVVLSGQSLSTGSYNRVDSEFANIMAFRNVQDRVVQDTAQDLFTRLSIFFQRGQRS